MWIWFKAISIILNRYSYIAIDTARPPFGVYNNNFITLKSFKLHQPRSLTERNFVLSLTVIGIIYFFSLWIDR